MQDCAGATRFEYQTAAPPHHSQKTRSAQRRQASLCGRVVLAQAQPVVLADFEARVPAQRRHGPVQELVLVRGDHHPERRRPAERGSRGPWRGRVASAMAAAIRSRAAGSEKAAGGLAQAGAGRGEKRRVVPAAGDGLGHLIEVAHEEGIVPPEQAFVDRGAVEERRHAEGGEFEELGRDLERIVVARGAPAEAEVALRP